MLFFNFDKNMVEAADEVRNAIGAVRHKLPIEMREPVLTRMDPGAQPIMDMALSSTTQSHAEISRLAEDDLADRFRAIPGVAIVNVSGALRRELSVLLRAEKLREFTISVTEVVNALRAQNTTAPVGKVRGTLEDQSIRLVGRIESPSRVRADRGAPPRRARSCAWARWPRSRTASPSRPRCSLRNGHPNVGIDGDRSREASTVAVANQVRTLVADINHDAAQGHHADRHAATAATRRRTACNNVVARADLRRRPHDPGGLHLPQLVALDR